MAAEQAQETVPNIDVQEQASKVIDTVSSMNMDTLLHDWIIPYGTKILLAVVIYVAGKWIARLISKLLGKAALASTKDEMLQSFVSSHQLFSDVVNRCNCGIVAVGH